MTAFEIGIKNPSEMTNQIQLHKIYPYLSTAAIQIQCHKIFTYVSITTPYNTYSLDRDTLLKHVVFKMLEHHLTGKSDSLHDP